MSKQVAVALFVVTMVAVIVSVDVAFLRNHFWERLAVNVGIVLLTLVFGVGGAHFGHTRWGLAGGAAIGLGTALLILLIAHLLGLLR